MKLLKTITDKKLKDGYKKREASRAIIFDENNLIPILFVSKQNYHKLPGGGIEKGENKLDALTRELKEETGCEALIEGEVGMIIENRYEFNLKQTSYCYYGKVINKGSLKLEQSEIDDGFELLWVSIDEAIKLSKHDSPDNYEGKFIQDRDLTFLLETRKICNDSQ